MLTVLSLMTFSLLYFYVGLSAVVGVAAHTRGRDSSGWLILALVFSPLIIGPMLLALPKYSVGRIYLERPRRPSSGA
jgi:hypothetical protein